jgi:pimeloyl-ACP methyl ester carboxylesterase
MSKYLFVVALISALAAFGCSKASNDPTQGSVSASPGSKEVTFKGAGGLELKGTLLMPKSKGPFPALLLLPGSGPSDRDSNQPGYQINLLKEIAENLAKHGVATLRFDKRATQTYKAQFPQGVDALNDFFTWENFVADAEDGFNFLKSQLDIKPDSVGVLGHSEGGIIAVAMAKDVNPKALVLVSTPGRNLGDVIEDQIANGYSAQFTPPDLLKKLVAGTKEAVDSLRTTGKVPADLPQELNGLFQPYISKYLSSLCLFEPTSAAKDYHGKVLIVQGEKDIQVSPTKDAPILFKAFPAGVAEMYTASGCSHCMKHPKDATDPGLVGVTDTSVLEKISGWASGTL